MRSHSILNRIMVGLMLIGMCCIDKSAHESDDVVSDEPVMVPVEYRPIQSMSLMIDRLNFKFELLDNEIQELWYQADLYEMDYDTAASGRLYRLAEQLEDHRSFLIERMKRSLSVGPHGGSMESASWQYLEQHLDALLLNAGVPQNEIPKPESHSVIS